MVKAPAAIPPISPCPPETVFSPFMFKAGFAMTENRTAQLSCLGSHECGENSEKSA